MKKTNRRLRPEDAQWLEISCPPFVNETGGTLDLRSFRGFEFLALRQTVSMSALALNRNVQLSLSGEGNQPYNVTNTTALGAFSVRQISFLSGQTVAFLNTPYFAIPVWLPTLINPIELNYVPLSAQVGDTVTDCLLACKVWR